MITSFEQLVEAAAAVGPRRVVVMYPDQGTCLSGAVLAQKRGLGHCTLIGDAERIAALARETSVDLEAITLINEPSEGGAIREALRLCKERRVDLLVNGGVSLRNLLPAILDDEHGLRSGALLSGVSVLELDGFGRLLLLSDGLMVVSPDLGQRIGIVQNAIQTAHKLHIDLPHVALVAATEAVDPKSQVSMDAAHITMMARRNQIVGAVVDGPLGFDNAISSRAAQIKGIDSDVAGRVDVLIAPDIESGNLLLKTLAYLCRCRAINVVVGGTIPLLLPSPDDDAETHLTAIALGVLLA